MTDVVENKEDGLVVVSAVVNFGKLGKGDLVGVVVVVGSTLVIVA